MSTAAEILVVITSAVLVIFLIVAIVLVVLVIRVTTRIKRLTKSGEAIAANIERATKGLSRAGTPLFFLNLVRGIITKNQKGSKRGKR